MTREGEERDISSGRSHEMGILMTEKTRTVPETWPTTLNLAVEREISRKRIG
jgi:hypothetical protein